MIIPLIVGFLVGKTYGKELKWMIISLGIGITMGTIGGLELIPFAYPLYATQPLDWIGLPEYRPIAIYFGFPSYKIHQEVVLMTEISPLIISILTIVCVVGVLLGQVIGSRRMKRRDLWPAEE